MASVFEGLFDGSGTKGAADIVDALDSAVEKSNPTGINQYTGGAHAEHAEAAGKHMANAVQHAAAARTLSAEGKPVQAFQHSKAAAANFEAAKANGALGLNHNNKISEKASNDAKSISKLANAATDHAYVGQYSKGK